MRDDRVLEIDGLWAGYHETVILQDIHMSVGKNEIVCLLGKNASGKTTLIRAILGLVKVTQGEIRFQGKNITNLKTPSIVQSGISVVPEAHRIFGRMTVLDNLLIGACSRKDKADVAKDLNRVNALFPVLDERRHDTAGGLSGGQQQMLAIARALMASPTLILMDEPSQGLAPSMVQDVYKIVEKINQSGVTILLIEQNVTKALQVSDRGYVLDQHTIVEKGYAKDLMGKPLIRQVYLGESV